MVDRRYGNIYRIDRGFTRITIVQHIAKTDADDHRLKTVSLWNNVPYIIV